MNLSFLFKLRSLFVIILVIGFQYSNCRAEEWFKLDRPNIIIGSGISTYDQAISIKSDSKGNNYYTGYFEGVIVFGSDTLVSRGNRDIFVCKIDNQGNYIWASSAGSEQADYGKDLAINSKGEVFVTGYFFDKAVFGNSEISAFRNSDIFVAKLDSLGNWVWATNADGSGFDRGNSIVIDNNNNSYISGYYESTINFDAITLNSLGSKDIFVAKLDSLGNWKWAKTAGSISSDESYNIYIDNNYQNLYLSGYFTSTAIFGSTNLTSAGARDPFIAKISVAGNWDWAKRVGSSNNDEITASFVDNSGIYVGGFYSKSFALDTFNLSTPSGKDIWLAKINPNGNWIWVKSLNGLGDDGIYSITGNSENILISGAFEQNLMSGSKTINASSGRNGFYSKLDKDGNTQYLKAIKGKLNVDAYSITINNNNTFILGSFFDSIYINNDTINSKGESDIFLFRADSNGDILDAKYQYGLSNIIQLTASEVDKNKEVVICGYFYGSAVFGKDTLKSNGIKDAFISKYSYENGFLWSKSFGSKLDDELLSIAIDSSNNYYFGGSFSDTFVINNQNYSSNGFKDILLVKTDSDGIINYVNTYGSIEDEYCTSLTVYGSNIAITGIFYDEITFSSTNLISDGDEDIFVLSLSLSGNFNWAVRAGGPFLDKSNKIITGNNSLILVGSFDEGADFGSINLFSSGGDDMFIAKLNYSGIWQWAKSAGTQYYLESANSVIYYNNHIYFAGNYQDLLEIEGDYVLHNGDNDILIGKLSDSGSWIWKKQVGGPASDLPYSLTLRDTTLYLASTYSDIIFVEEKTYSNNGKSSTLVISFDSNGNIIDSFSESESFNTIPNKILFLQNNNFILSGNFQSYCSFGNLRILEKFSTTKNLYLAVYGIEPISNKWKFTSNTGRSSQIILPKSINPKIGNNAIAKGDAVGVFYTRNSNLYCAGYSIWNDEDLTITVWGDNLSTLVKDGISDNENYIFKAWNSSIGQEVITKVKYSSGPNKFENNTQSVISQFPFYFDTLNINLSSGWNLISTNAKPSSLRMDSIFKNYANDVLIAKNIKGNVYIPSYNINTIGDWNIHHGYQVYAIRNTTLQILGDYVQPEEENIILPIGWSFISYLGKSSMNISDAFASIKNKGKLLIAKNILGKVYIPSYNINTIGNMVPGHGYQVYFSAPDTLWYPANSLQKNNRNNFTDFSSKKIPEIKLHNPNNSTFIIEADKSFNNFEIAVLSNKNKIIGTGKIINGISIITIYGYEEIGEFNEFALEGEELYFNIYDPFGELVSVISNPTIKNFDNIFQNQFVNNQIYKFTLSSLIVNEISISPNPSRQVININSSIDHKNINYEVYDLNNKLVLIGRGAIINIENLANGIYHIKIKLDTREVIRKFVKVD